MAKARLSIRVELVSGFTLRFWPRPGRLFAASRTHSFEQLSTAIDDAFARWDRAHLWAFLFEGDLRIKPADPYGWMEDLPGESLDAGRTRLGRLKPGERFAYEFDFGDSWMHLCTVDQGRIDPMETLGIVPGAPLPYWGWGDIPDQYGRRWERDDRESPPPPDPRDDDLPPIGPWSNRPP